MSGMVGWGGRTSAVAMMSALWLQAGACGGPRGLVARPGTAPEAGAPVVGVSAPAIDARAVMVVDAGAPATVDAGATAVLDAGAPAADARAPVTPVPPLVLADGCDTLLEHVPAAVVPGTFPAQGPYRPCATVGGQKLSAFELSQDGTRLAALDLLGQAVVLDATTLETRARFARHRGPYLTLALSANGTVLAAAGPADGELDIFDIDAGTLIRAIDLGSASSPASGLALSPDGARVAAAIGPDLVVIDVASGVVQPWSDGARAFADQVLFVDGGRKLATARYSYDAVGAGSPAVTLLDLTTGGLTTLFSASDIYGWMNLAVSADGATLLAFRGGEIHAWDTATGAAKTPAKLDGFDVRQVLAVDASGSLIGVSNDYGTTTTHVQVRRIADGALVQDLPLAQGMTPALLSLDHDRIVVTAAAQDGSGATRLGVLDTAAGRTIARACSAAVGEPYSFASVAPRLLSHTAGSLLVYDAHSGEPVGPMLGVGETFGSVALSPDGAWVAWSEFHSSSGMSAQLANAETGEEKTVGDPSSSFLEVVPSSAGQLVAISEGIPGSGLSVIDVASLATLAQLDGAGTPIAFSPDGGTLISSNAGKLQAVDWRTGNTVPWPTPTVPAAAQAAPNLGSGCVSGIVPYTTFSADGSRVLVGVSCGREGASNAIPDTDLYDVASGTLIQSFPNPTSDPPAISSDGSVIAFNAALWCR